MDGDAEERISAIMALEQDLTYAELGGTFSIGLRALYVAYVQELIRRGDGDPGSPRAASPAPMALLPEAR